MAIGLSGLFHVTGKQRDRKEVTLEQAWNGGKVIIQGVECDEGDLGVLLAILSLAMKNDEYVLLPGNQAPPGLITDRRPQNLALTNDVLVLKTTKAEICRAVGVEAAGNQWVSVDKSLRRLMTIVVEGRADKQHVKTHLIHDEWGEDGGLNIHISARLTKAVMGEGSYAAVSMRTYRKLRSAPAKILYGWLSAWFGGVKAGERSISFEKIERHVYGGLANEKSTRSRRKKAISEAIAEVNESGAFSIALAGNSGHATISRTDERATKD